MPSAHVYFDQIALDYIDARGKNRSESLRKIISEHAIFASALVPDSWTAHYELEAADCILASRDAGMTGSLAELYVAGIIDKKLSVDCVRWLRKLSRAQELAISLDLEKSSYMSKNPKPF